jgi:succinate dehydrogenase/fumarate reductase flavoprotein subunit
MASRRNEQPAENGRLIETDVLVIGGGPSAAWAALSAAEAGARVVLADKGYHGTSGATAPSNTGTWCVPPGEGRAASVEQRFKRTAGLADRRWMLRSADRAYENLQKLVEWGYPFPSEEDGSLYVANLRGPDYMRFMRRRVHKAGVTILDHHPILELLGDDNHIGGAAGLVRRTGASFRVSAGAVVLATGGCAFFERILGGTGLTGDGYLFAVEAGASLSGMEFTGKYTLAPHGSSLNKGLPFRWATFYRENGEVLRDGRGEPVTNGIGGGERQVADAMLSGPVYARLDLAEPAMRDWLRRGQPNCFQPCDRMGIDPFEDLFRVELKYEGTVRGTGGIRLVTSDCATGIAGLYAAGDAASRENVTAGAATMHGCKRSARRVSGEGASASISTSRPPPARCTTRSRRSTRVTGARPGRWKRAAGCSRTSGRSSAGRSLRPASNAFARARSRRSRQVRAGRWPRPCSGPKAAACIAGAISRERTNHRRAVSSSPASIG